MRRRRSRSLLVGLVGLVGLAGPLCPGHAAAHRLIEDGTPVANAGSVRRFALVVGANDGGSERVHLRYAGSDAATVATVLEELGGIAERDRTVLENPAEAAVLWEIGKLAERVKQARARGDNVQFVFYYSGHSDERGLLLGEERMEYKALRKAIDAVPADVRVAILDSCASGAFTRQKGGTKRAPFMVGGASDVKGHAYLTSSSADEAAQESDRVKGSFFTHYLITGLRGAADADGDKLITLSEAYQFAFDETLARTESTRGGAQHAAYDINLSGSGDLVLTDLRRTTARLELADDVGGRVFVRRVGGALSAELYKPAGSGAVLLALEPGRYQITVDDGENLLRGERSVGGTRVVLARADLRRVRREHTVQRGDDEPAYLDVPFNIGLFPPLSINGQKRKKHPDEKIRNTFSFGFAWSRSARIDGAAIGFGPTFADDGVHGVQMSTLANVSGAKLEGAQLSAGGNLAREINGAQLGVLFNAAKGGRGFQGAMINHTRGLRGTQMGLVNVAGRIRGAQVGLFSFAKTADAQLALISATREYNVHPEVWTSDTAMLSFGLRFPAKYTYTGLFAGLHPVGSGESWTIGGMLGGHIRLPARVYLDVDFTTAVVANTLKFKTPFGALVKLRVLVGWQPFDRLAVYGGPTLNVMGDRFRDEARDTRRPGYGWEGAVVRPGRGRVRIWPGFAVGVRF